MKLVFLNILLLACLGCHSGEYRETEYASYMFDPDNGLVVEDVKVDWKVTLQYRTKELMALIEKGKEKLSREEFDNILLEYDGHEYYLLKLQYQGKSPLKKHVIGSLIRSFQFDFKSSISCVVGVDTLSPTMYHYESGANVSQDFRMLIAFEELELSTRKIIIDSLLRDKIKLEITEKAMLNLPKLIYD